MKLKLLTAILMTLAAVAWLVSAFLVPGGDGAATRWIVAAIFAGMSALYWRGYFRLKNSTSVTE